MNKNEKDSAKRISDVIPSAIIDSPIIGMTGNKEITVDGFKGIVDYTETSVSFKAGSVIMTVGGGGLSIRYLSVHTIVISGEITAVEFNYDRS